MEIHIDPQLLNRLTVLDSDISSRIRGTTVVKRETWIFKLPVNQSLSDICLLGSS